MNNKEIQFNDLDSGVPLIVATWGDGDQQRFGFRVNTHGTEIALTWEQVTGLILALIDLKVQVKMQAMNDD